MITVSCSCVTHSNACKEGRYCCEQCPSASLTKSEECKCHCHFYKEQECCVGCSCQKQECEYICHHHHEKHSLKCYQEIKYTVCSHCTQKQEEDPLGEQIYGNYVKQDQPAEWEKELEKLIHDEKGYLKTNIGQLSYDIPNFIHSLLSSQKQNLIREVEGMKGISLEDNFFEERMVTKNDLIRVFNDGVKQTKKAILSFLKGESR